MKFANCLLLSLTLFLYLFQPACLCVRFAREKDPARRQVIHTNTNELSSDSVLEQLAQIVIRVYKTLFKQVVKVPSKVVSKPVLKEKQDGYIFDIKGNKASIDLGKNDEIKQGMLLDIYRKRDIYDPLTDSTSSVPVPLGKIIVTEVHENTAEVYLSNFEVKTEKGQQNGETVFSIQEGDRVRRPAAGKKEKPRVFTHILLVTADEIHIDFVENIKVGNTIEIIKGKKEAVHPITKKIIQLNPEKKATLKITEIRKDRSIGKIISSDEQGRFVVNDNVRVIKLD